MNDTMNEGSLVAVVLNEMAAQSEIRQAKHALYVAAGATVSKYTCGPEYIGVPASAVESFKAVIVAVCARRGVTPESIGYVAQ